MGKGQAEGGSNPSASFFLNFCSLFMQKTGVPDCVIETAVQRQFD